MTSSPPPKTTQRVSYRSPETAQIHLSQKVEAIYNALREHKVELREPEQYIDIYSPDVLLRILDAKAGREVNREVFLELFERVKKDMRSQFNIYDWINVYIEAEDILVAKTERTRLRISDLNTQESQLQSWLEAELNNMKSATQRGGSEEKSLWINLLDGDMIEQQKKKPFGAPTFIVIKYGDKVFESKVSENQFKPKWNQAFKINLNENDRFFTISLRDVRRTEYGSIKLNVAHFEDQKKRKEWMYLSDNSKEGVVVRLQSSIVLLKSNVDKIQNDINEVDVQINECSQDLNEYEKMLSELYAPFTALNFGEFRMSVLNQSNRPSVFSPQGKVGRTEKKLVDRLTAATQKYISNWARFFYAISIAIIAFAFLANMIRVSFIEIVVIFFVYIGSITESLTQTQFRMSLFFGLLGVFQDVIWLLQNTKNWCNVAVGQDQPPACSLTNLLVLLTYIGLGFKVIWWLALWRNSVAFQEYQEKAQLLLNKKRGTLTGQGNYVA